MFRPLTEDEIAAIKAAKDWVNAELKRPRQEALAKNAELRKVNKGLPWSLKQPYVKVPDAPKLITGQPVRLRVVANSVGDAHTIDLLVDYQPVLKYVRKLKRPEWMLHAMAIRGQQGEWALEIRYWHVHEKRQGRVVFEQINVNHRALLGLQTLPEVIFIEGWAA